MAPTLHFVAGMAGAGKTTDICLAHIHERNERQPEEIFFGIVTDAQVAEVNAHFVAPSPEERFNLVVHRARVLYSPRA